MEEGVPHRGVMRIDMRVLRDLLLLPDTFEVETVHVESLYNELRVYVKSPDLPATEEFQQLPTVEPIYSVDYEEGKRVRYYVSDIHVTVHPIFTKEEFLAKL